MTPMRVCFQTQKLEEDQLGRLTWRTHTRQVDLEPDRTAIIVCDMWDQHWCPSASQRVSEMVPKMKAVMEQARNLGVHIIHAPSDTMEFYAGHPARLRVLDVSPTHPTEVAEVPNLPLPIDDSDGGADQRVDPSRVNLKVWSHQHEGLLIDPLRDVISDDGLEIHAYLTHQAISHVLIMGVHTNMCILNRSFGIRQLLRWGVPVALVRDLTDAMYNPALSPYVSHDQGTQLVVEYIEKFYCPTVLSSDLVK